MKSDKYLLNQTCTVRWGSSVSNSFQVKKTEFDRGQFRRKSCFEFDKLIKHLRASTIACQLNGVYHGDLGLRRRYYSAST